MKVKVIQNKIKTQREGSLINSDLSESLKPGMDFYVFAVEMELEATYYYIFHNYYLFPVPSQMFEIVEDNMPIQWKVKKEGDSHFLCPSLFNEPYFYDRFSDHDKDLSDKFKSLAAEMYPEFVYEEW